MGSAEPHIDSAQYVSVLLHSTPAATLIQVSGELDLGSVHHLEDCLNRALANGDGQPIHVDLGKVSFIDCVGFEPLTRAAAGLPDGRVLTITSASSRVRRLMELIGDVGVRIDGASADIVSGA
jgi:anti-anti-sigma factor